jgi:hypothetical protein
MEFGKKYTPDYIRAHLDANYAGNGYNLPEDQDQARGNSLFIECRKSVMEMPAKMPAKKENKK